LKKELKKRKMNADVISKIETQQALDNFDEILEVSEGIMIARGDLGIETPMEEIPYWQKKIIKKCLQKGKPVITATQMLESMVKEPLPTRAEISDVGNAILDKTDAVMLSGETAMGKYPVEAVSWMVRSALFLEDDQDLNGVCVEEYPVEGQTEAITKSAFELSKNLKGFKGFLVLTESGNTARKLARLRPSMPIYAFTHDENIRDQMYLVWGIRPYLFDYKKLCEEEIRKAVSFLNEKEDYIKKGDKIIMIFGTAWGTPGKTNMVRVVEV
jgi:pyruvate kinase